MLLSRSHSRRQDDSLTPSMAKVIISVLAFLVVACFSIGAYILFRRRRQTSHRALLPTHQTPSHHRQLSISTTFDTDRISSIYVYEEKHNLIANSPSPARTSIPEIRITFPDEADCPDDSKGGRVVVVRVGDSGTVGMEPLKQEHLPPYSLSENDRFQSLELDRIGGLKDSKEEPRRWS